MKYDHTEMRDHTTPMRYPTYINYIVFYGWRSDELMGFVKNIRKQGWCSHKQLLALQGMCKRLAKRRLDYINRQRQKQKSYSYNKKRSRNEGYDYASDFTHYEEMQGSGWGEW